MKKKTLTAATTRDPQTDTLQVAYHDGPPEIGYFGEVWRRGEPRAVTPAAWSAMQARSDFSSFDFRIEPAQPADKE